MVIQIKVRSFRNKHEIPDEKFVGRKGWLQNFIKRSGIEPSIRLCREAGEVNKGKVHGVTLELCKKLSKYEPEHSSASD